MPEVDYQEIMKKLSTSIAIIVLSIVGCIFFIVTKIVPQYNNLVELNKTYTENLTKLDELKAEYQQKLATSNAKKNDNDVEKPMYVATEGGFDTESIIAGEFSEIFALIKANSIKTREIDYLYDKDIPQDAFIEGAQSQYSAAQLNMDLVASYKNFENFLKDLYKHDHFLDINAISIEPYEKNKSILLINFKLKLYAKKGA